MNCIHIMKIFKILFLFFFTSLFGTLLVSTTAFADQFKLRLLSGFGTTSTDFDIPGIKKRNTHYLIQFMNFPAGDKHHRGWGIELGRTNAFKSDNGDFEYDTIGVITEAAFWGMTGQVGTVGHLSRGARDRNPFGFRTSLGKDFLLAMGSQKKGSQKNFFLSTRLRQDVIFDDERISTTSLELGIGIVF